MITAVAAFAFLTALATAICAMWRPKALAAVIPCLFLLALYGTTYAVNYVGYAVDSHLLKGMEAQVFDEIDGSQFIYLLVQMHGEKELRLVRMAATEQNRKDAQKAKQQSQQGLAVIRFGEQPSGKPGEAQNSSDGIRLLDLAESKDFGKGG